MGCAPRPWRNGLHPPCTAQTRGHPSGTRGWPAPPSPAAFSPSRPCGSGVLRWGARPVSSSHPCVFQRFLRISGSLIHLLLLPRAAVGFGIFKSSMWDLGRRKSSVVSQTPPILITMSPGTRLCFHLKEQLDRGIFCPAYSSPFARAQRDDFSYFAKLCDRHHESVRGRFRGLLQSVLLVPLL